MTPCESKFLFSYTIMLILMYCHFFRNSVVSLSSDMRYLQQPQPVDDTIIADVDISRSLDEGPSFIDDGSLQGTLNHTPSFSISTSSPLKSVDPTQMGSDAFSNDGTLPISEDSSISDSKQDLFRIDRVNTVDQLTNVVDYRQSQSFSRNKPTAKLPSISMIALLFTPLKRTPTNDGRE